MNRTITILTLALLSQCSYAQITTSKVAEKKKEISTEPYDSLQNFLGKDVYKYIGQDFYLKGKPEQFRKNGYADFLIDYQYERYEREINTYKCCDGYYSKYDDLVGKYFNVAAVHKHPKAEESSYLYGKKVYLELIEKESGDKLYFEYNTENERSFPFVVVGFFEKEKNIVVGQKFVFANKVLKFATDIQTGDSITNTPNQRWDCTDLTIEERHYILSLVVKNSIGQSTTIRYEYVFGESSQRKSYTEKEAKANEQKFGKTNWLEILDGNILTGFTEEMVLLSWGKPEKVNTATYGDQWVYSGRYLYFENGNFKSFN